MSEKHAQQEQKTVSLEPYDFTLNDAVLDVDFGAVEKAIAALPPLDDLNNLDPKKYKDRGSRLAGGLRQAIKACMELSIDNQEPWRIALRILWEFAQHFPIDLIGYSKCNKPNFDQTYEHLAFDRVPPDVANESTLIPLNAFAQSALTIFQNDLNDKEILNAFCFLIKKFRAMGWGREIFISDDSKKALSDFKNYLENISPEISKALSTIPSKDLNVVLPKFIQAFKAGKAEDDAYLKNITDALTVYTPKVTTRIICEYAGFFAPRAKASSKPEPKGILEQLKAFVGISS